MNKYALALSAALIGVVGATSLASAQPMSYGAAAAAHQRQAQRAQQAPQDNATANYSTDEYSLLRGTPMDHDPHWGPAQDANQY
ncbi:hypothetical protein V5F77_09755 [Xanthobacter sp. DSM 24535]|uniref:hypothetical protein n=1 Tax=Roseixanthobacter psychrophilus TaxID=3119917 RepID=UPI00372B7128